MRLTLYRFHRDADGTVGLLMANGAHVCLVGELPWRDNRNNVSCIPSGAYQVKYLPRSGSGRYRDVYHVQDVPGRTGILIHVGNYTGDREAGKRSDSWGCLLPGKRLGQLGGQRCVLASRGALSALHAVVGRKDFDLEVISHA